MHKREGKGKGRERKGRERKDREEREEKKKEKRRRRKGQQFENVFSSYFSVFSIKILFYLAHKIDGS